MYKLIQYYLNDNEVKEHLVAYKNTIEEIKQEAYNLAEIMNEAGIKTFEVIATKNINSLIKVLEQENRFYFRIIKME
jgi:site-specific recombinase XerD